MDVRRSIDNGNSLSSSCRKHWVSLMSQRYRMPPLDGSVKTSGSICCTKPFQQASCNCSVSEKGRFGELSSFLIQFLVKKLVVVIKRTSTWTLFFVITKVLKDGWLLDSINYHSKMGILKRWKSRPFCSIHIEGETKACSRTTTKLFKKGSQYWRPQRISMPKNRIQ